MKIDLKIPATLTTGDIAESNCHGGGDCLTSYDNNLATWRAHRNCYSQEESGDRFCDMFSSRPKDSRMRAPQQIRPQHEGQYQSNIVGSTKDCTEDDSDKILSSNGLENDSFACNNICKLLDVDRTLLVSAGPTNPVNSPSANAIREHYCLDPPAGEGLEAFEQLSCSLSSIRERLTQVQSKLILYSA